MKAKSAVPKAQPRGSTVFAEDPPTPQRSAAAPSSSSSAVGGSLPPQHEAGMAKSSAAQAWELETGTSSNEKKTEEQAVPAKKLEEAESTSAPSQAKEQQKLPILKYSNTRAMGNQVVPPTWRAKAKAQRR